MRPLILISLALAALAASAAEPTYPLWDGQETIAEYAKRANLEPTKTLDLGNGVKLEMVLIPAGKFVMGTEQPEPWDPKPYMAQVVNGYLISATGGALFLILIAIVVVRSIRTKTRPQVSLAYLLILAVVAGIGLMGGLHTWFSRVRFDEAIKDYEAKTARYRVAGDGEKPAHEVTLPQPFYLGKFEVTQEQYQLVMGRNQSIFRGRDMPVEKIVWGEAQEFCKKIGARAGASVRLPTEAEWEYACRAGTRTTYNTGDTKADLDRAAWHSQNGGMKTHPVGQKTPNAWGLFDMHGNMAEWCSDLWRADYQRGAVAEERFRVVRGGTCFLGSDSCRSAGRGMDAASWPDMSIGFRVVVSLPSSP